MDSSSKKILAIGLAIGLVIGTGMGYGIVQQRVSDLESQINTLQRQINERNNQITTLQSQISEKDKQISDLQSQIGEKESQITTLQSQISQKESQITDLQSEVSEKDNQISNLEFQISELKSQIEELELLVPPLKRGAWNLIKTFSGKSGITTDYFYVAGTELRINWTWSSSVEEFAGFTISLYKEGQTVTTQWFTDLQKKGTTFVHNIKPANYYLEISEANLDQWTVSIEVWIPES